MAYVEDVRLTTWTVSLNPDGDGKIITLSQVWRDGLETKHVIMEGVVDVDTEAGFLSLQDAMRSNAADEANPS